MTDLPTPEETHTCNVCKVTKPLTDFYRDVSHKNGRSYTCKLCNKEYKKKTYSANIGRLRRQRYPEKYKAVDMIKYLVRAGKLIKEPCFLCGEAKAEGHHLSYDYPKKVVWLCRKHHKEVHNGF